MDVNVFGVSVSLIKKADDSLIKNIRDESAW